MINVLNVVSLELKTEKSSQVVFYTVLAGSLELWDEQGKTLNCSRSFLWHYVLFIKVPILVADYVTMALQIIIKI